MDGRLGFSCKEPGRQKDLPILESGVQSLPSLERHGLLLLVANKISVCLGKRENCTLGERVTHRKTMVSNRQGILHGDLLYPKKIEKQMK